MADVADYMPKLLPNGFMILDDASRESVSAVGRLLDANYRLLLVDDANDLACMRVSRATSSGWPVGRL
jgi:hypothetical protein